MIENEIFKFCEKLWPQNRSLSGEGNRETLKLISEELKDLTIQSLPTYTKVFDWEIPDEWIIRDAYFIDESGKKYADFKENNLHLCGYSSPIDIYLSKEELLKKLHTLEKYPDAIPYVTSYYKKDWGFCLSYNQYKNL